MVRYKINSRFISRVIYSLFFIFLLSGCYVIKQAERVNKQYHFTQRLKTLRRNLDREPFQPPLFLRSLYPITSQYIQESKEALCLAQELVDTTAILWLSRILGEGDLLVRYSPKDSLISLAEGNQLLGNLQETKRIIQTIGRKDHILPTKAINDILLGDTINAVKDLEQICRERNVYSPAIRKRAAWLLSQIQPWNDLSLSFFSEFSVSPEEHLYCHALELQKKTSQTEVLKKIVHKALSIPSQNSYQRFILLLLRPILLEQSLFVESLKVHNSLSNEDQNVYPYFMLSSFADEITLLEKYEQEKCIESDELSSVSIREVSLNPRSFSELYGQVERRPNWGLKSVSQHPVKKKSPLNNDRYREVTRILKSTFYLFRCK